MALVARVIGLALLTALLAAWLGFVLLGSGSDGAGVAFVLGCVGGLVGAVAGAAREIVMARGGGLAR